MKKRDFEEIQKNYLEGRKRLENIAIGDLVWEEVCRFGDNDYHPAVVKSVNVDEDYVSVIDVSDGNKEKEYTFFETEEDMLRHGFTKESLEKTYKGYTDIINKLKNQK